MATQDILMPLEQEGSKSIVRAWLKQVGDAVTRDEPIVDLETDKVAVEVPAPADGVLAAITLGEGDDAPPGAVLGVLTLGVTDAATPRPGKHEQTANKRPMVAGLAADAAPRIDDGREMRLSPLVQRLVAEHRIDVRDIAGTGRDGRITHKDVEAHMARGGGRAAAKPAAAPLQGGKIPHDAMRKSIAAHMSRSVATAPHVTAVFEADFSAITAHRAKHKDAFAKAGAPLT
jgi:2-oxoglutarate dehydrogenase E2 component (dihydrolipoamide succinyltransferase)